MSEIKAYERNLTERLFVRSFNINEQGDIWINASQVSENSKIADAESVKLKVSRSHPHRNRIFEQLGQAGTDLATFQVGQEPVVPDPDNPESQFYQVQGISGLLTPEDRKLERSTYTQGLDEAVDTYFANRIGTETTSMVNDMLTSKEGHEASIKQAAFDRFYRTVQDPKARALIPNLGTMNDVEIKKVFENIAETKGDLHTILKGEEVGSNLKVRQIGYHADHSFSMQANDRGFGSLEEGLSAIGNYAFQGGAADTIEQSMGNLKMNGTPILETASTELVTKNYLVESHPTRSSEDYAVLGQEFGQVLGGNTLRAYTTGMGAKPSSKSIPLMKGADSPGGDYQRKIIEGLDTDALKDNPEELIKANERANELLRTHTSIAIEKVANEQDKAMNEGEMRVPPGGISPEATEEAYALTGKGLSQMADSIDMSINLN